MINLVIYIKCLIPKFLITIKRMFFNIPLFLGATKIVVFFESKNLLEKKIRNHEKIYTCVTNMQFRHYNYIP